MVIEFRTKKHLKPLKECLAEREISDVALERIMEGIQLKQDGERVTAVQALDNIIKEVKKDGRG